MIPVKDAIQIVQNNVFPLVESKTILVKDANGQVLFTDISSPIDMPPFRQSAMDGYALHLHDSLDYDLINEVKAGDGHNPTLVPGQATRIFTGARVPDTANSVIKQELVSNQGTKIVIDQTPTFENNIRAQGEQIAKNQVALTKGTKLSAAGIGYLTTLGITEIEVYRRPTIAIVVTGSELIQPGEVMTQGKIYESNGIMLESAVRDSGFSDIKVYKVADNYKATFDLLNTVIDQYDMVIVSGGISVGDYDFVGKALKEIGVQEQFYKVKQKPGKPLFFGTKDRKTVFALPGNPASALNCYYIYVLNALQLLSGNSNFNLNRIKATATKSFIKKGGRAQFLKAKLSNGNITPLEGQSSAMLHTFAIANALIYIPAEENGFEKDTLVETIVLPITG